jgi:hypothetical protein
MSLELIIAILEERKYKKTEKWVRQSRRDHLARAIETVYPSIKTSWIVEGVRKVEDALTADIKRRFGDAKKIRSFKDADMYAVQVSMTGAQLFCLFQK